MFKFKKKKEIKKVSPIFVLFIVIFFFIEFIENILSNPDILSEVIVPFLIVMIFMAFCIYNKRKRQTINKENKSEKGSQKAEFERNNNIVIVVIVFIILAVYSFIRIIWPNIINYIK